MLDTRVVAMLSSRGRIWVAAMKSTVSARAISRNAKMCIRDSLGVQLPQGPGGGVPGIGHEGLALQLPAGIDLREHRPGHIDLAPDDEPGQLLRQLQMCIRDS